MNRRAFALSLSTVCIAAAAQPLRVFGATRRVTKAAEELKPGEFNWFPERSPGGPILIIVSLPDQLVHVYRNGVRIAASTCSTGKPGHRTPTGVFKILQKDRNHRSSTYDNAPMPNMNRLTWSGVALHAGNLPGYPASHGCVRLPLAFSALLFSITTVGMTVVIADEDSQPTDVVHPGMVLGDYARREFDAVDRANLAHQYSAAHASEVVVTSVVVSRKDSSITIWENGRIVASGRAKIIDPDKPLGSRVYTLTKLDKQSDALTWVSATYSERSKSNEDKQALMRIRAYAKIRAEIEKRMQQGMTLVTTDDSANAKTSSGPGFTVMTGVF